jgi:hypothetical protein
MRKTIAQLEDELKEATRRNDELRRERDERDALVAEMREHVETSNAQIESWIEAFDMEQDQNGLWQWDTRIISGEEWFEKYRALVKQWNAAVADFNVKIAPRPVGRPLAASEAQVETVLKLRKQGTSLRDIVDETSLSFSTVRNIVGNQNRTTRTWKKWFKRIQPDRLAEASWRSRSRQRAALPRRINEGLKTGRDLVKQAKGLK